ncbi:MAG: response regulator [Proteobacteria bacterium]|nr:MAG: response regulator [Pseudomonadota bacterium]
MNILLVDDAVDTRDLFCLSFALQGHTVHTAEDGEGALDILTQHREILDVVIMDQNLPVFSGLEVVQRMRQLDGLSTIPVILFTGETKDNFESQARESGVACVLYKPLVPSMVMVTAQEVINRA